MVQLLWQNWNEVCEFADVGRIEDGKPQGTLLNEDGFPAPENETVGALGLLVPTKEGVMIIHEGQWIGRDGNGELFAKWL